MQPKNILLHTYRKLVAEGQATVDSVLTVATSWPEDDRPAALITASNTWRLVGPKTLAVIDEALINLGDQVVENQMKSELTPAAKSDRAAALADHYGPLITAKTTEILSRISTVTELLLRAGFPTRPQPRDAAQEAAIAGIKTDLQMVLGPIAEGAGVVSALTAKLQRAIADADELQIWLLSTSHWIEDYFASRRMTDHLTVWSAVVSSELDRGAGPGLNQVRRAYSVVSGRAGFNAISTSLHVLLPQIVAETSQWQLTRPGQERLDLRTA